ncbi:MAG: hypothetical protein H0T47_02470 [Planctomycetaceae bacterium]|nr:hypothetical protein [Planctomycetaceae bacterium]
MAQGNQPAQPERKFAEIPPQPAQGRRFATRGAPLPKDFGPLEQLMGVWIAQGTGWNMIALPFQEAPLKFRLLMNRYDEELRFIFVDANVKNRGLLRPDAVIGEDHDQLVATLDYQQVIHQVVAEDRPHSGLAGDPGLAIHHEPGLWLFEKNRKVKDDQIKAGVVSEVELDVARLASIPHGNSVLAVGKSEYHQGMPPIPPVSGLPSGQFEDVSTPDYDFKTDPYLEPYKHYIENPFKGGVTVTGFPGFSPADMNAILRFANEGVNIVKTTTLTVDTNRKSGDITNLPFSVREADPVSMKSTFWIQELAEQDAQGKPKLRLQYSQVVMLHFFHPREDETPGRAVWPHISIATLEKVPADYQLVPA